MVVVVVEAVVFIFSFLKLAFSFTINCLLHTPKKIILSGCYLLPQLVYYLYSGYKA